MTLLVVGGSGFLGRELLRRSPDAIGISSADVDIRDAAAVAALFQRVRPQTAINTAYRRDDRASTFDGAVFVARAAAATGARLVQVSTDLVFDGEKGSPYVEQDQPAPLGEYGRAKADAERAVLEACPGAAARSPTWIGQRTSSVKKAADGSAASRSCGPGSAPP